jgi:hypothetical protein
VTGEESAIAIPKAAIPGRPPLSNPILKIIQEERLMKKKKNSPQGT